MIENYRYRNVIELSKVIVIELSKLSIELSKRDRVIEIVIELSKRDRVIET